MAWALSMPGMYRCAHGLSARPTMQSVPGHCRCDRMLAEQRAVALALCILLQPCPVQAGDQCTSARRSRHVALSGHWQGTSCCGAGWSCTSQGARESAHPRSQVVGLPACNVGHGRQPPDWACLKAGRVPMRAACS